MPRKRLVRDQSGTTLVELVVALGIFVMIALGIVLAWTKGQETYFVGSEVATLQQNARTAMDFMIREIRAVNRDVTVCAFDYTGPGSLDCTTSGSGNKVDACATKLGSPQGPYYKSVGGCGSVWAIPATNATATKLEVRADRNDNGTIAKSAATPADDASEDVTYQLEFAASGHCPAGVPACITRKDGNDALSVMVAVDISNLVFQYFPRIGYTSSGGVICAAAPCMTDMTPPLTQADADNVERIRITVTAFARVAGNDVQRTLVSDVLLRNRF